MDELAIPVPTIVAVLVGVVVLVAYLVGTFAKHRLQGQREATEAERSAKQSHLETVAILEKDIEIRDRQIDHLARELETTVTRLNEVTEDRLRLERKIDELERQFRWEVVPEAFNQVLLEISAQLGTRLDQMENRLSVAIQETGFSTAQAVGAIARIEGKLGILPTDEEDEHGT